MTSMPLDLMAIYDHAIDRGILRVLFMSIS